jgi:hypothetical protein
MEKQEYVQRFEFSTITPFKDYSRLDEKPNTPNTFVTEQEEEDDDIFRIKKILTEGVLHKYKVTSIPQKRGNKKVHFFTTKEETQERFNIQYAYNNGINESHSFDTTNERQIKKHYGRAFSEITCYIYERSVKRNGDKVTIRTYVGAKTRHFNSIYFKRNETVMSITVNTKTGDVTLFESGKSGRRKTSRIRKNDFFFASSLLHVGGSFFNIKRAIDQKSRLYPLIKTAFNDRQYTKEVQKFIGLPTTHNNYGEKATTFMFDLIDFFVKKKEIKVPDGNFVHFITKFYPTKKYLKKNDNKLIASVLDMMGIKSKSTIRILHKNQYIDLGGLTWLCSILDDGYTKYISNLKEEVFKWKTNKSDPFSFDGYNKQMLNQRYSNIKYHLKDVEKENLIRIFNNDGHEINFLSEDKSQSVNDHFNMIHKLRDYLPDLHMKARTYKEFQSEHAELSKMIAAIRKGWVIEYQYDDKTIKDIESPIDYIINIGTEDEPSFIVDGEMKGKKLSPHILKREEEYIEEGTFMHHCVATYADKDKSMIVSLRTEDGSDRVTIEYDIQTGKPIQKRHFCNRVPPDFFTYSIIMLDEKIKQRARWGTLNWKEKKKVPIIINGVQIQKEQTGPRTELGYLFPF